MLSGPITSSKTAFQRAERLTEMKAWFLWVRRFDLKPEPQVLFEMIPASTQVRVIAQRELTEQESKMPLAALERLYPAPAVEGMP